MNTSKKHQISLQVPVPERPAVVGTVHSPGSLDAALRLRTGEVDFLECRLDSFHQDARPLWEATSALKEKAPLIFTARHPAEGGVGDLDEKRRNELLREFLPWASFVDIELQSCTDMAPLMEQARERGVGIILSLHDFKTTPGITFLRAKARAASAARCKIFKVATRLEHPSHVATLTEFSVEWMPRMPMAVMGMGRYGMASRISLASLGSVLNYGYLDTPNAPGQWEALELKRLIEIVQPSAGAPSAA